MDDLMIKVENVSKRYILGQIGGTTLYEELQRLSAKLHGREDPTKKIGTKNSDKNESFLALDNVSFEVKTGERVGIIGHNGAGKSTLLKLISRVTAPTSGSIGLNGRVASMLEVGTGFHPELTGRENIYMNGAILGMSKKEINDKIDDIIEFSECRQFIDTPIKRYSSGMYVKLAFAVAAHLDAEIMIMDEVLAVGDVAFQNKCIEKMTQISKSGRTILYVSHNMATIRTLCNRCMVLNRGKLQFVGDNEEAIQYYMANTFNLNVDVNLLNCIRPYPVSNYIKMTYFRIIDKQEPVYRMGEKMKFSISWVSKKQFENLILRTNVFSFEKTGVGISFSDTFRGSVGENTTLIELDISHLLPEKYIIELVMLEMSVNGVLEKHDIISRDYIMFEIIPNDENPVLRVQHKTWGYVEIASHVI